ncbi:murein transglycosylase A [Aquamicrobium sp. LC103]|uniref:murein transglycosylase A n=1 Tax=Aquamicrobium sp. LC103 TaxID=1120658 RepID=UPI00063ECEF2|nr:murein transglycosylase A [Aquamicrobium sp. LC103]TKT82798.1 transglycosylase [Aquamicrobium sp. LC103]
MTLSSLFRPISYDELPGWSRDDAAEAFTAFRRCAVHAAEKPYRTGALGVAFEAFDEAYREARGLGVLDTAGARAFFERHFRPCRIAEDGFVTGFYEPIVDASPVRTGLCRVPLLAPPADLVPLDDDNRPADLDPYLAFGRRTGRGIVEYFDRPAIETGVLGESARAIAWLDDPVDAFFIHVQGSARLRFPDGRTQRVTYAAKSGQRFTGAGKILVELGEIPAKDVTMQSIRAWFRANPSRIDEILRQNRSYIFFAEAPVEDPELGPIAAAKVPLAPGRSIAVDRLLHTFGTPFYVDAPALGAFGGDAFRRLMIAQDTGSAIVGPARGDLFAGSGDAAGDIAGVVKHAAVFHALVPRSLLGGARR